MADRAVQTSALAFPKAVARPMTGWVELGVAEALASGAGRAARVTQVLATAFHRIGGVEATPEAARRLATGARAWLLTRASLRFLAPRQWFTAECGVCGAPFDVPIDINDLPVAGPGEGFPVVQVATSLGPRRFEAPNGRVEEALAGVPPAEAARALARLTGLSEFADEDAARFDAADLAAIEAALDRITPDVGDMVSTRCPACGAADELRLDPVDFAFPDVAALDRDIHAIASAYGWSEAQILELRSDRRRRYARLIAADRTRR